MLPVCIYLKKKLILLKIVRFLDFGLSLGNNLICSDFSSLKERSDVFKSLTLYENDNKRSDFSYFLK